MAKRRRSILGRRPRRNVRKTRLIRRKMRAVGDNVVVQNDEGVRYYKITKSSDKVLHREGDLPAVELVNGKKEWRLNGLIHREGGLPASISENGDRFWFVHGKRHREDGPAVEFANGSKQWWVNGKRHRLDGPAIEWNDIDRPDEYWISGRQYSEEEFLQERQRVIDNWDLVRKVMIRKAGPQPYPMRKIWEYMNEQL